MRRGISFADLRDGRNLDVGYGPGMIFPPAWRADSDLPEYEGDNEAEALFDAVDEGRVGSLLGWSPADQTGGRDFDANEGWDWE